MKFIIALPIFFLNKKIKYMAKKYWLFKSDPEDFGWDDLKKSKNKRTSWSGVRNYQVRNFIRDDMKKGDWVLFYHSNAEPNEIKGICEIVKEGYADDTQFKPDDPHYFPSASMDEPIWYMVDIQFKEELKKSVTLDDIKKNPKLKNMKLVQKGSRLSISPVTKDEYDEIIKMSKSKD